MRGEIRLVADFSVEEIRDGRGEEVVLPSRDHVPCTRDISVVRVRNQIQEMLHALFGHEIRHLSAHQESRDMEYPRRFFHRGLPIFEAIHRWNHPGVEVPVIATAGARRRFFFNPLRSFSRQRFGL